MGFFLKKLEDLATELIFPHGNNQLELSNHCPPKPGHELSGLPNSPSLPIVFHKVSLPHL